MIELGTKAPDFKLKEQKNKTVQLSKLAGKLVLLSFRPLAWTPVCTDQMKSLEDNFERFGDHNTVALGIGVDSLYSNRAWAEHMGIQKTRLLSDFWPHGKVAKLFGVFRNKDGFSERANILINEMQLVIFAKTYPVSELPDIEEIFAMLDKQQFTVK